MKPTNSNSKLSSTPATTRVVRYGPGGICWHVHADDFPQLAGGICWHVHADDFPQLAGGICWHADDFPQLAGGMLICALYIPPVYSRVMYSHQVH